MKKLFCRFAAAALAVSVMFCLSSCKSGEQEQKPEQGGETTLSIVTTLFPQYDFAKKIAGDKADVKLLLSPGVEAHSYDPTIQDISAIGSCDLFIYTGDGMEPWVKRVLSGASVGQKNAVIDLSSAVTLKDDIDGDEKDPHMWLDMKNAVIMADEINSALCGKQPENKDYYTKNADALKAELNDLDEQFKQTVQNAGDKKIFFGGRFAYKYFTDAYNLKYETVYNSCTTDVEPSSKTVAKITEDIKASGAKYIFHEELADPKVARSIADAAGCSLAEFSTAHNLSKEDFESGVSFVDIMKRNLENLKKGLA